MNTQELRDAVRDGKLTPLGMSDLALQLCTALDEARAEARHLGEYEIAAKSALGEVRTAHARADREAIRAAELLKRVEELEERCKYFLQAEAWVRAKVARFIKI
jgi:hypothetical protein